MENVLKSEVRVRVIKKRNETVKCVAYKVEDGEFGGDMPIENFMRMVGIDYGNPLFTATTEGHIEGLIVSANNVGRDMKAAAATMYHIDFEKVEQQVK